MTIAGLVLVRRDRMCPGWTGLCWWAWVDFEPPTSPISVVTEAYKTECDSLLLP